MGLLVRNLALLVIAGLLAILVHLSSVLSVPYLAPIDAWSRLAILGEVGRFITLPSPSSESSIVPRGDPATLVALCRYDLDESGQWKITGRLNIPYWGFSAHDRHGMVFYAINNRSFGDRPLALRIMSPDEVVRFRADLPEDAEQELLVAAPEARGFVLVRMLVTLPSLRARIEAELNQLQCQPTN